MDPADLPDCAGRLHDHFTVTRPDHHRLLTWGRLELTGTVAPSVADPVRETVARKIDQLREAQRAGRLDPAWDPVDVLALVTQIATTWAAQTEIGAVAAEQAADPSLAARRAAIEVGDELLDKGRRLCRCFRVCAAYRLQVPSSGREFVTQVSVSPGTTSKAQRWPAVVVRTSWKPKAVSLVASHITMPPSFAASRRPQPCMDPANTARRRPAGHGAA